MILSSDLAIVPKRKKRWSEVYATMSVHTQNAIPTELFQQRRPLESENEKALKYREDNYRNTSKSAFDLAIDQYLEVANSVDAVVKVGEVTSEYLEDFQLFDGFKMVDLRQWLFNFVGRYRQTDPNSFVVVLPRHPFMQLIPSFDAEIPDFNNVKNQRIGVYVWLIASSDIDYISDYHFKFKAGEWKIDNDGTTRPYYFSVTNNAVTIHIPFKGNNKIDYRDIPYYDLQGMKHYPAFVIGGKSIVERADNGVLFQYYVSDFYGGAQVSDLLIGQLSDLQIVESRFVYPEKWVMQKDCPAHCMPTAQGIYHLDGKRCSTCKGEGYIVDTTPLGTHVMTEADRTDSGDIKPPVGFISPDVSILKHGADRVDFYNDWKSRELGLMSQNMTNQSGESKRYDMMQKVSMITAIVTDLYRLYENVLGAISTYLNDTESVEITLPKDMDVKNADDISIELSEAKKSDLPYPAIVELTRKFMLAKFGNNEVNKRIIDFLSLEDKLFVYGIEDLKSAVAVFGSDITNRDKTVHLMGWQILTSMHLDVMQLSDEDLRKKFYEKIDLITPEKVEIDVFSRSLAE